MARLCVLFSETPTRTPPFTFTSFIALDTLSFVGVRFIAYNKNPNNNTRGLVMRRTSAVVPVIIPSSCCFVACALQVVIFVFCLLGMEFFGGAFDASVRTKFDNLYWAFLTVFQVLTTENINSVVCCCALGVLAA